MLPAVRTSTLAALLFLSALAACKSEPPAPGAPATPSAGPAGGSEIEAGLAFLKAVAKLNHKDEVDAAWTELAALGAPRFRITGGGQALELDIAGKKSEARLLKFSKLQSWREGATVRGVTLGEVEIKAGQVVLRGPGKLTLVAKGDRWEATGLEIEAAP